MLRVLHFAEDSDTSGFFPQLARWHDRRRYQMYFGTLKVMAPWLREYMIAQGVECLSCSSRIRAHYPLALLRLVRMLRSHRIDILHTHLFDPSIVGQAAGFLARTHVRVVTRHHSDYHTRIHKPWHVRLDRFCTWASHAVIAVSQHTADHLTQVEHAPLEKVHVIHNGIDFDRVRVSDSETPRRLRRELAGDGTHVLLVVARLHPEKGHEHLFAALPLIQERVDRPVVLLVAGEGTAEAEYREKVRSLGWEDRVRFLGFRRDISDVMAAADVLVLPSVAEAFGLVLPEALHLGVPIVATQVGGIPEIVRDGVDGILVPPANPSALATAVAALLNDEERRCQMADVGRDRVRQMFGFENMVRSYERLYEHIAAQRMK